MAYEEYVKIFSHNTNGANTSDFDIFNTAAAQLTCTSTTSDTSTVYLYIMSLCEYGRYGVGNDLVSTELSSCLSTPINCPTAGSITPLIFTINSPIPFLLAAYRIDPILDFGGYIEHSEYTITSVGFSNDGNTYRIAWNDIVPPGTYTIDRVGDPNTLVGSFLNAKFPIGCPPLVFTVGSCIDASYTFDDNDTDPNTPIKYIYTGLEFDLGTEFKTTLTTVNSFDSFIDRVTLINTRRTIDAVLTSKTLTGTSTGNAGVYSTPVTITVNDAVVYKIPFGTYFAKLLFESESCSIQSGNHFYVCPDLAVGSLQPELVRADGDDFFFTVDEDISPLLTNDMVVVYSTGGQVEKSCDIYTAGWIKCRLTDDTFTSTTNHVIELELMHGDCGVLPSKPFSPNYPRTIGLQNIATPTTDNWININLSSIFNPTHYEKQIALTYQFTLHVARVSSNGPFDPTNNDFPNLSDTIAGLNVAVNFANTGFTFGQYTTTIVPGSAKAVRVMLPFLDAAIVTPTEQYYYILMSPINLSDSYTATELAQVSKSTYTALFKINGAYPSSCLTMPCTGSSLCDEYLGICGTITSFIDPTTAKCHNYPQVECPPHHTKGPDCTQCLCLTAECQKYTRTTQIKFKSIDKAIFDSTLNKYKSSIVKNYLTYWFNFKLQLNQLDLSKYSPNTWTPGDMYNNNEFVYPLGYETITLQFMNPAMTDYYVFDTLLVAISLNKQDHVDQNQYDEHLTKRFETILSGLQHLTETWPFIAYPTTVEFATNQNPTSTSNSLVWVSRTIIDVAKPLLTTKCQTSSTALPDFCPLATPTLIKQSPYWSQCNAGKQTLTTVCFDLYGVQQTGYLTASEPALNWCQPGYYGYPQQDTVACPPPSLVYQIPTTITITSPTTTSAIPTIDIGQVVEIKWDWDITKYNPLLTIDVLFYPTPTSYSKLLTTVLASQKVVTVIIPTNINIPTDGLTTAVIKLRCTQYVNVISTTMIKFDKITLPNKCPVDNPNQQCGNNAICDQRTGQCQCKTNYMWSNVDFATSYKTLQQSPSTTSLQLITATYGQPCKLPCEEQCKASLSTCNETTPNQCTNCPIGMVGQWCEQNENCNQPTDGAVVCNGNGYYNASPTAGGCGECQCNPNWDTNADMATTTPGIPSGDCNVCSLLFTTSKTPCSPTGTNFKQTNMKCDKCHCLPGYSGDYCSEIIIRGNITFILTTQEMAMLSTSTTTATTKPSRLSKYFINNNNHQPQLTYISNISKSYLPTTPLFSTTQFDDVTKYLTPDGIDMVIRDIALSLGIDPQFVDIVDAQQFPTPTPTGEQQMAIQQSSSPSTTTVLTFGMKPTTDTNTNGLSLDQLSSSWNAMADDFTNLPISVTESSQELGQPQGASPAVQPDPTPECNNILGTCDDVDPPTTKSNTGVIVGFVVGVVGGVIVLFFVTILLVRHAKKHQKWCFAPEKKNNKDDVEMTNEFTPHQSKSYTGSTETPRNTMGTSAMLPINSQQGASSSSPASNVQTINNQTPVEDPSLPANIKAYKDAKGQVFYVDSTTMTTSWTHPNKKDDDNNGSGYGSGW